MHTVKSGNFVTIFAQNMFFVRNFVTSACGNGTTASEQLASTALFVDAATAHA
jgi:hypothetical protein